MSTAEPILPQAQPVTITTEKSALLVLDLSENCADPNHPSHRLVPGMSKFLDKARAAGALVIFTISARRKGKPEEQVYSGFKRRPSEAVIFPDGFDKFTGGELQSLLELYEDIDTLIITGCRSNICVLHTATKAARELNYNVVIPIDGLAALTDYEQQYTLYHFTVLPRAAQRFTFTTLDMISFQSVLKS